MFWLTHCEEICEEGLESRIGFERADFFLAEEKLIDDIHMALDEPLLRVLESKMDDHTGAQKVDYDQCLEEKMVLFL